MPFRVLGRDQGIHRKFPVPKATVMGTDVTNVVQIRQPRFDDGLAAVEGLRDYQLILFFHQTEERQHIAERHFLNRHPKWKTIRGVIGSAERFHELLFALGRFRGDKGQQLVVPRHVQICGKDSRIPVCERSVFQRKIICDLRPDRNLDPFDRIKYADPQPAVEPVILPTLIERGSWSVIAGTVLSEEREQIGSEAVEADVFQNPAGERHVFDDDTTGFQQEQLRGDIECVFWVGW